MTNSADPDQLASSEANWSGSALFAKGMSCLAREGLIFFYVLNTQMNKLKMHDFFSFFFFFFLSES